MVQPDWTVISEYGVPVSASVAETVDLALAEVDPAGAIRSVSSLGAHYWGWTKGEQVPPTVYEALDALRDGKARALPVRQGGLSLFGVSLRPKRGWLLIGYAEEERDASEHASTFKSLIEKVPVLVLRMRADGTVIYADTESEAVTGYLPQDVVGRAFWMEAVHSEDRWKLTDALRRAAEGQKVSVSLRFLTPSEQLRLVRLYLLPAAPGAEAEVEALLFDVTEESEVEALLMQSEALYRTFLEQSPMGVLHLDAAGIVTFENHPFRQIIGESAEDAWIGRSINAVPGLDTAFKDRIERMLREGEPLRGEEVRYRRGVDRPPSYFVVHASPIRQPGGVIVGGVLMIQDVTEERQREFELRLRDRYEQAEVALREAVLGDLNEEVFLHEAAYILGETTGADSVHVLTHVGTEGNCITRAAWVRNEQADPVSLFVRSGDYPDLRRAVVAGASLHLHRETAANSARRLFEVTDADEVIWTPFFDAGRLGGFVLFGRSGTRPDSWEEGWNETERRLIDRVIQLFETLWSWIQVGQRYRLTVAKIDDCLFTFSFARNGSRRYLFVTPQIERLTGYKAEEVLARSEPVFSWCDVLVHPEDREVFEQFGRQLRSGRESRVTYRIRHRDGSTRWLCEHATPHRDATGRVTVSGILMDVTERKAAEEVVKSAREQAESASRLKSTFVATMSHELRTPLGAINGFAELLTMELAEWEEQAGQKLPPQIHEFADAACQNAKRLLLLADDLFVLSNVEIGSIRIERRAVALHPLIERCAGKMGMQLSQTGLALRLELDPGNPRVIGDPQRIEQILDNLLGNTVRFTNDGGIVVRTSREGSDVLLEVSGTGVGVEQESLNRLFAPFLDESHWANRQFESTGLGLALVKRLVELMKGRIEVESDAQEGTTFRLFLPAAEE